MGSGNWYTGKHEPIITRELYEKARPIKLNGKNFLHYASMKSHLGFYPTPSGVKAFENDLKKQGIDFSKGCIRFSYDKALPVSLITKIIKFRLKEENARSKNSE